jgi:AraC-like DNA-binding protein
MALIERFIQPGAPLDEVATTFYCLQSTFDCNTVIKHFSPNFEMILVFNFGKPVKMSFGNAPVGESVIGGVTVIGPIKQMLNYELLPGTDAIIVVFRLNGFFRFFDLPLNKLGNELVHDPDKLIGKHAFIGLWRHLKNLADTEARVKLMVAAAIPFIQPNSDAIKPLLDGESYFNNLQINPVKAIASDAAITERAVQLQFQKQTGYSPKELIRFLRFKRVITELVSQPDKDYDIFDLIARHGYHDQSHLIKDFNQFLNTTPLKFLKNIKGKNFCIAGQEQEDQS